MARTADHKQWMAQFADFEKNLNGQSNTSVHSLRKAAIQTFDRLGLPTSQDEAWKTVNLSPLTGSTFEPAAPYEPGSVTQDDIRPFTIAGMDSIQMVFVNGHFAPKLSSMAACPDGVQIDSLAARMGSGWECISEHLARYAKDEEHAFTALNMAFLEDGAFVFVPRGVVLETPVHVLFVTTVKEGSTVTHPRTLVLAGENSQVTLLETYAGLSDTVYFTNAVTEIVAGDNAVVDHYRLELESLEALHVANFQTALGQNSNVSSHSFSLGGGFVRNDISSLLAGEGCEATINGLYLLEGSQHLDNYTLLEHTEPHCPSHELYKGILGGNARAVFRGKIHVHQKAQKTDAYQSNQNILLSDNARVNTKPQLEIYADDVKCSHGATIGQMDEDALFYMRARGIPEADARQILLKAFADDIVDRVKVKELRTQLDRLISQKLEKIRMVG